MSANALTQGNSFAISRTRSKGHLVILGLVGIGVSIILMAAFANIPVTMVATLGIGFWVGFLIVPTQVLQQEETPKNLLGRVTSSLISVMSLSQVLAMSGRGPNRAEHRNSESLLFERRAAGRDRSVRSSTDSKARLNRRLSRS
jgi:hypothetical protein